MKLRVYKNEIFFKFLHENLKDEVIKTESEAVDGYHFCNFDNFSELSELHRAVVGITEEELEKLSQLKGLHSYFVKSVFDEDLIKVQNLMEHLEDFSLEEAEFEVSQELFGENINLFKLPDELTKLEFYKGLTRSKQDQILFVYNELCTNSCKAGQSLDFYADQARNNIKFNIPEDKKIKVVFKKAGNKLILEIVDQYGGLLYDDIKKIFNSNAILEVNRLTLGSGIGLNLVKLNSSCLMFKVKEDHYTRVTSIIDLKGRKKHHLDVFSFKIEKYGNQDE